MNVSPPRISRRTRVVQFRTPKPLPSKNPPRNPSSRSKELSYREEMDRRFARQRVDGAEPMPLWMLALATVFWIGSPALMIYLFYRLISWLA